MTQTLFWVGMVVIALGIGLGYWDLRDRLARIESDLKHLYYELGPPRRQNPVSERLLPDGLSGRRPLQGQSSPAINGLVAS